MKKLIIVAFLTISTFGHAQQEIKIDIADALILKTLEFSYEYYFSEANSVGISTLFNLAKESEDFRYNENSMITPYYRHYFTTDARWNFFGEAFAGINSGKKEISIEGNSALKKYTDTALGVAVGSKYISGSGLIIDFYAGLGRNLFSEASPIIVPRVGLNVGWRF